MAQPGEELFVGTKNSFVSEILPHRDISLAEEIVQLRPNKNKPGSGCFALLGAEIRGYVIFDRNNRFG